MYAAHNYGSVWIDEYGNVNDVERASDTAAAFYVTETENADLGTTNTSTLSVISNNWDELGCHESNGFCHGADINLDGEVNDLDVADLFYEGGANISVEDDSFVYQAIIGLEAANPISTMAISTFAKPTEHPQSISFPVLLNNSANLSNLGRTIMFSADDGVHGDELWTLSQGAVNSFDLHEGEPSSEPRLLTKQGRSVYFVAKEREDHWSLYRARRHESTRIVDPPVCIMPGICPAGDRDVADARGILSLGSWAGRLYFTVIESEERQVWTLDANDLPVQVGAVGEPFATASRLCATGDALFLVGYDRLAGYRLLRYDGTAIESIQSLGWNAPGSLTAVGETVFFATRDGLWTSDGTAEGTVQVATIKVETDPLRPMCVWHSAVYFPAFDPNTGIELWRSDGIDTHPVKDIAPGPDSSLIPNLQALPNGVVFSTTTAPDQAGLWITDGTPEGTQCLADFSTADDSPLRLHQFHRFMGRNLTFLANDRLFRYQGVTGDLALLTDSQGHLPPDHIRTIATASDKLVIITKDDRGHQGLWLYGSEN